MAEFIAPHGQSRGRRPRFDAVGGCRRTSGVGDGAETGVKGPIGRGEYWRMGLTEEHSNWLKVVDFSHRSWCKCPDWRTHVPGWPTGDAGTGDADHAMDIAINFDLGDTFDEAEPTDAGSG